MHENESGGGPVLRVKGIDKSFGAVQALKDVELEVRRGEVLALIGDNGAGKSTLINVITGVLGPDSGEIVFEGEDRRRGQGHGYQRQKYPNIEYLGTEYCNDNPTLAAFITTSTLRSTPDLKGIFGANLFSGQGAGTGLKQAGKENEVSVVAFDASPTQVEDLRRGRLDALIAQHPNDIGDKGVRIAVDYLKTNKEPTSKQITTGFTRAT